MSEPLRFCLIDESGNETEVAVRSLVETAECDLWEQGGEVSDALGHLGVTLTGKKTQPDNADPYLFFFFRARVSTSTDRRTWGLCPIIEVGRPWRRGMGMGLRYGGMTTIYGVWCPWFGPKMPPEPPATRSDVSPGELLGMVL